MAEKISDYRGMSGEQLAAALTEQEKHLFQLRFQSATDRLETPSEIRKSKRQIARIQTLQRERQLADLAKQDGTKLATMLTERDAVLKALYATNRASKPKGSGVTPPPRAKIRKAKREKFRVTDLQAALAAKAKKEKAAHGN